MVCVLHRLQVTDFPPAPSTRQRAEGAEPSPSRRTSDVKGQLGGKTQEVHVLAPCLLSAGAECQRLEGQNKKIKNINELMNSKKFN